VIEIKQFHTQYADQIPSLILNIQQNEFHVPITINDQKDLLNIPDFYQQRNGNFWVAVNEDEVVGTIALIDCAENVGAIRKMFVKKEYRGSEYGIAQNLLETLESWALEHDINHVYLGTLERLQAAIRFYIRNGYEAIEKQKLPAVFPLMPVDTHFYSKNLKQ
jgi:putative acetyltransferase